MCRRHLEARLLAHYLRQAAQASRHSIAEAFEFAYAALGAQRNTKILGIFVRLSRRDGKAQYLAHLPRIWRYVERNLRNPRLASLAAWYERISRQLRARCAADAEGVKMGVHITGAGRPLSRRPWC